MNERHVSERFAALLATYGQRFQGDHGMRYHSEALRDHLAWSSMPPVAFCVDVPAVQLHQEASCLFACLHRCLRGPGTCGWL